MSDSNDQLQTAIDITNHLVDQARRYLDTHDVAPDERMTMLTAWLNTATQLLGLVEPADHDDGA